MHPPQTMACPIRRAGALAVICVLFGVGLSAGAQTTAVYFDSQPGDSLAGRAAILDPTDSRHSVSEP